MLKKSMTLVLFILTFAAVCGESTVFSSSGIRTMIPKISA